MTTAIARAPLTYELTGPANAPVTLALGGISATRHVAASDGAPGWWANVAGAGLALDTRTTRLLGVDYLDGGRAAGGRPAREVTTRDQAAAIVDLLDALAIDRLDAVIGASYGGMVALALAAGWPERVGQLVVISAPDRSHPMATALRVAQRRIVELGLDTGRACDAMIIARSIAMTTYRSAMELGERFDAPPVRTAAGVEFPVERYLAAAGERFAQAMRPERFLALSLSADLHRVAPSEISVPVTVIAAEGDTLVPEGQLVELAGRLPSLRGFHVLPTRHGHDAFLTEPAALGRLLTAVLEH